MNNQIQQPRIGIITANASQSEQKQILNGIISQAQTLGADTIVFSNIYNSSEYFANIEIENKIYDLIISKKLSGLILTAESFLNADLQQSIHQKLLSRSDIPIVVTGAQIPGFIGINNNVQADIEDIVRHLVEVHGFTDIDFMTGEDYVPTSHERVEGYKKVLIEHNIPFEQNKVMFGDFWMNSGEKFAYEYINGIRRLPQAIICANDYMAYGLCDTFIEHGVSVPDDVTVMGYEYVGERFYHAPILTTYQRNRKAVGAKAFNLLWEKMTGIKTENVSLSGYLIYGDSCSCGIDKRQLNKELVEVRREQYYSQLNLVGNFEQEIALCRSITDYVNVLQQFTYLIRGIKGLHLCLYENWCSSDISSLSTADNVMETMVCYRVISQEFTTDEPVYFNKYELFPDVVIQSNSGDVMYMCPIFFSGKEFGYFILQYDKPDSYDIIFRDWLKIAANALESLRMRNDISTLLECRNLSAYHDSVTGLYNENGLKNELARPLKNADDNDSIMTVLIRSELFTDNNSLEHQNISVRIDIELSENLKKIAFRKNTFCAKLSDKLYALCSVGTHSEEYINAITDKLNVLIKHSPLYREHCGIDSLVMNHCVVNIPEFSFDNTIQDLREKLNEQINTLSAARKHTNYTDYLNLRNQLYLNPEKEWDAQNTCRNFHLSYGHFRATYKEFFGISFHQDIIHSRISLAKYLLLTTALNIPSIAYKCGYEDDKYFMRQFRQLTGNTPNAYRSSTE